ncbi:MAG: glycerate kinase type-2 family protein [Arenicella sp.]
MKSNNKAAVELTMMNHDSKALLIEWWNGAVNRVRGRVSVRDYLNSNSYAEGDYTVIAVGKAASDMMLGAHDVLGHQLKSGLVLTKYAHIDEELIQYEHIFCHESAHPIPDQHSMDAGNILLEEVLNIPEDHHVLMLISGGASSLVEVPVKGVDLAKLQELNNWGLNSGLDINEMNYMRQKISLIKGGGLCRYFGQQSVQCLYISDVPEDNLEVIGSGLLYSKREISDFINVKTRTKIDKFLRDIDVRSLDKRLSPARSAQFSHAIIADNCKAKQYILTQALEEGFSTPGESQCIDLNYQDVAELILQQLTDGPEGVYVWGGEPTVVLPENPGLGGRNQALALLLAVKLSGIEGVSVLVAGTDGTDGPTDAAGGVIDGDTYQQALLANANPDESLERADAYPCLAACNALFVPGPTGTNVMDLIIAYKKEA